MIQIVLARADLARVRFAHSALHELVTSLRVLHDPASEPWHCTWRSAVQAQVGALRLDRMAALAPTGRDLPDFMLPPATAPVGELAEEQGNHPDICFGWGRVEVTVWTHKINGLTESDFVFAAKVDTLLGATLES